MADNIAVTPGAGTTIAADDVGGVLHQRVKISIGADGSAADLVFGQGAMAASLPVTIANNQSALAVTGSFYQATQPVSGTVAVSGVSGSVAVTGAFFQATQPVSGTVGISGTVPVSGTFWQATQPVSLASQPLPTGAATEATLSAASGKLPASLGSKTGVTSLSVVPASDSGFAVLTATFTRPATTPVFVANQLLANNATAGSVVLPSTAGAVRVAGEAIEIRRLRLRKNSVTLTNAVFRVFVFHAAPTVSVGDTGAFDATNVLAIDDMAKVAGYFDVTMNKAAAAGAMGIGISNDGASVIVAPTSGTTITYAVMALAGYTGVASEVFTIDPEVVRS